MERRLAAILSADAVGYSRLMGEDEAATLESLNAHREQLIGPKVTEHHGRIVDFVGDNVLAEFPSVVDAVECAVAIQAGIAHRNTDVQESRRIIFRIGINLGDVIVEGGSIHGDGVNVAARLEALAEPGGIYLSLAARDQVVDKLELAFEDLDEIEVKNIARPIRVFRVLSQGEVAPKRPNFRAKSFTQGLALIVTCVAMVIVLGGIAWWQPWVQGVEPAVLEKMLLSLPEKPSIAVLPFTNVSGEDDQAYFADGITDDLITDLSKLSGVFVISRNSTFSYKGRSVKVQQVAEELGIRYVLEGSVRRAGDQVRINAQLIDALSGYHLWAERYDGSMAEVFKLQDEVVGKIVSALAVNLTTSEEAQIGNAETKVLAAYDAFLQARDHFNRQTPQDFAKAIKFLEKAIELDPDYSRAYAGLAAVHWVAHSKSWHSFPGIEYQALERAKHYLQKALRRPTSSARIVSAEILLSQGRHDLALAEIDRAIALEPNFAVSYVSKAWILTISGRAEDAEQSARAAMRLNPNYGTRYLRELGRALFFQQRHAEAAEVLERAVSRRSDTEVISYRLLSASYGHLGRIEEARTVAKKRNERKATIFGARSTIRDIELINGWSGYEMDEAYLAHFIDGLRKAGFPEGAATEAATSSFKDLVSKDADVFDVEGAVKVDAAEAKALFDRGAVFVDVRPSGFYSRGHIPNAVNLHIATALTRDRLSKVVKLDEEVVFHCDGEWCFWSPIASAQALVWGYKKVYYFAAGFPAWKTAGYPVEVP